MNPYDVATGSVLTIFLWCFWQGLKYYMTPALLWYHRQCVDDPEYTGFWAERVEDGRYDGTIWACMAPPDKNDHPRLKELNREFLAVVASNAKDPWIRKVAAEWLKNNG